MRETFGKSECERAEQLVGYLYGESGAVERSDFERHLRNCAACRDEAAAFTRVRGFVADFRTELLRAAPAVSLGAVVPEAAAERAGARPVRESARPLPGSSAVAASPTPHAFAPRAAPASASSRAALAALGDFFRLSPGWLRASTSAAALVLCALALMGILNAEVSFADGHFALRAGSRPADQPASAPVPPPAQSPDTAGLQARLKSLAAERDAAVRELHSVREQLDGGRAADIVAAKLDGTRRARHNLPPSRDEGRRRATTTETPEAMPRSRETRRATEDEELPRLLDLIGGVN